MTTAAAVLAVIVTGVVIVVVVPIVSMGVMIRVLAALPGNSAGVSVLVWPCAGVFGVAR